jgi:biuret amidohydrolase
MSVFKGTPLDIALRDCGINSLIVGVASEIGIEPTIRHAADLGYIPIVVTDACSAGHEEAGGRALASIKFMGDAILTDVQAIQQVLSRWKSGLSRA